MVKTCTDYWQTLANVYRLGVATRKQQGNARIDHSGLTAAAYVKAFQCVWKAESLLLHAYIVRNFACHRSP
ncbi:hypothetical protein C8R44DRAFT_789696 [Mycena epipterygia]|nr:hypothetical protein C8R44DRAFT_789696 [Mycena epipterygia]